VNDPDVGGRNEPAVVENVMLPEMVPACTGATVVAAAAIRVAAKTISFVLTMCSPAPLYSGVTAVLFQGRAVSAPSLRHRMAASVVESQ
jgi:hypothetical protein